MNYLSVCSGIEAATVGWHSLGWKPVAFSEIEPFPCAALAHYYPNVPKWGDMTKFKEWPDAVVDVLVGGTPCQSFSVAGLRKGLDDPRGNLMLTYLAIAAKYRPRWVVWENVPGVLSSGGGEDFASLLRGLGELGYGFAYRVLDAQYFGVPQRRRRVFVVGHLGNWQRAAAVLFERHSLQGHPAPRREAGQRVAPPIAPSLTSSGRGVERGGDTRGQDPVVAIARSVAIRGRDGVPQVELGDDKANAILTPNGGRGGVGVGAVLTAARMVAFGEYVEDDTASAMKQRDYKDATDMVVSHALRGEGFDASEDGTGRGTPLVPTYGIPGNWIGRAPENGGNAVEPMHDVSPNLTSTDRHAVALVQNQRDEVRTVAVAGALAAEPGAKQQTYLAMGLSWQKSNMSTTLDKSTTPAVLHSLYNKGINQGENDASPQEINAGKILLRVRQEIGAQAFAQWGLGILDSLRTAKILRPEVHGEKFRQAPFSRSWVVCCALGSPLTRSEGAMQSLREAVGEGCPSQGWESLEQCADELGAYLSQLSQPGAQAERFMRDLWQADEGAGLLREALSEIQKVGRSAGVQAEPAHVTMQVRRLTVTECEFLQGFPRNYTLITVRNKPAADGPRYKALGNSMAVPVMAWIGKRIQQVEEISCTTNQKYHSA